MATQNVDHAHANGHSNQNNKKRARIDEDGVHSENSQNTSSSNSNPPPTKKRKVHKKPQLNGKRRKSKKMRKSEDENQQEYLTLLANDAKKTQNNHSNAETDEEAHIVLSQSTTSPTTDNRSDATSPVSSSASESTLSNDASSPLQQQPEPDVTPPLPDNLSVLPFAAPFRDRDEHEQKYDSDDRSQETQTQTQNPQQQQPPSPQQQPQNSNNESATSTTSTSREQHGWSVSYSPSDSISFSLQITPQARTSRPMAQQQTPNDTEDTEAQEPQQQLEMEEIGDPFADTMFDDIDVDGGGELVLESVSPFESMVVRALPAEPMHENHDDRFNMALSPLYETNAEENEHENYGGDDGGYLQNPSGTQFMAETQRTETEHETVEKEDAVERLGPFQVIVARATSMAQSMVDIGWEFSRALLETVRNINILNVVAVLCAAVCVYVLSTVMFIPYAVAPWTETPFCDTHGSMITGTYAVFYDLIPLEQAMACHPCPSGAQCVNGSAQCARGTQLDAHRVVCIANDDRNAAFAANMSYQAIVILSERLGETDCGDGSLSALDETALLDAIQDRFYASLSMEELRSPWQFATRNVLPTRGYSEFVYFNQTSAAYHAMHATVPSWRCWLASNTKRVPDGVLAGFAAVLLAVAGVLAYLRWRVESEYHDDVAVETTVETANFVLRWLSEHGEYHFSVDDQMKRYVMSRLQVSEITWQRAVDYIDDSQLVQSVMEDIDGAQRRCWKWTAPVAFVPLQ